MRVKENRMTGVIALLVVVLLTGCATITGTHSARDAGAMTELLATVEYIDDRNQVIDAQYQPGHLLLVFPYIPGQIFGTPGSDLLFTERLTPGGTLHLELESALPGLQEGAATLRATADSEGLSVKPARTRLARIGTFPFDAKTLEPLGEGGFIDGRTREHMILVYFDRPCVLSGTLNVDQEVYVHDIVIPAAGFHFLRIQQTGAGRYVLSRADETSRIVFSIHLSYLQQA